MNKFLIIFLFLSIFIVDKSLAQDKDLIFNNLSYINNQFKQYNKYHTIWAIDYKTKELVCFDKFGSYRGKLNDIIIKVKDNSTTVLSFKCKSGKCLKKIDDPNPARESYSMSLSSNLNIVVEKFNEILNQFNNNNNSYNSNNRKYSYETKQNVKNILGRLTEIFQTENKYKHKWYVDWNKNYIYSKTKSCEVFIPLGKNVRIEPTSGGYRFLADSKILREKCTSFDNKVDKTYNNVNSENAKEEVIYLFEEILAMTK